MKEHHSYQRWLNDSRARQIAHIKANARISSLSHTLGISLVIISSISASAFFSGAASETSILYNISIALGIITTIIAALQASLKLPEIAEKHHEVSVKYGDLRRDIEKIGEDFKNKIISLKDLSKKMEEINQRQIAIARKRPYVCQRSYGKVEKKVKENPYYLFIKKPTTKTPPPPLKPQGIIRRIISKITSIFS